MSIIQRLRNAAVRIEIFICLLLSRLLIKFVPFRLWRDRIGVLHAGGECFAHSIGRDQAKRARDIGRLVRRLARKQKFRAVCLPQAIAAHWMLSRRDIRSRIVIGTRRGETSRQIDLHAWLVVGNEIVTGQDEYDQFRAFEARAT